MIDFAKRAIEERSKSKVNRIFISEDERPDNKPFCERCRSYMVYVESYGYKCLRCGADYVDKKKEGELLSNKYETNPIAVSTKGKKRERRPGEIPINAQITSDIEYSPVTGGGREIEYDS